MRVLVWARKRNGIIAALTGISLFWELIRYLLISETSGRMADDAWLVWEPLASAVLSGTPLYIAEAVDNKPPLWLFQQLLAGASPNYLATNLLLVGLVNAGIAITIWFLVDRQEPDQDLGLLAAVLFLIAVPVVGAAISNKNAAILFVLLALTQTSPERVGGALGIAGLFAQQAVFAIPAVAWIIGKRQNESPWRWLGIFMGSGLLVVGLGYLLVAGIWGIDSALQGLRLTAGLSTPRSGTSTYLFGGLGKSQSLLVNPLTWVHSIYVVIQSIYFLLIPMLIAFVTPRRHLSRGKEGGLIGGNFLLLGGLLSLTLLIRPFRNYWVLLLPSLAVLASQGYTSLLTIAVEK